jgi:hypothetical protein
VAGIDSHMASVAQIEDYAKARAEVLPGMDDGPQRRSSAGDLAVIGGYGVHVETVRGFDGSNTLTYGGNTSQRLVGLAVQWRRRLQAQP